MILNGNKPKDMLWADFKRHVNWAGSGWFWIFPICRCEEMATVDSDYLFCDGCWEYPEEIFE